MSDPIKYPRTPHLPWSPGGGRDDAFLEGISHFEGREVVVTEKLDGENTTMYRDNIHARSLDGRHHPSRDWVKALHATLASEIPDGWRLCGENLYARHSIPYSNLSSYFFLFSVWDTDNRALDWDETMEWAELLELQSVPVWFRGEFDEAELRKLVPDTEHHEGYVVRVVDSFGYDDFFYSVAKWVREGHVRTDQHWLFSDIVPNELAHDNDDD